MTIREFRALLAREPNQDAEIGKVFHEPLGAYVEWSPVIGTRPLVIRSLSPRLPKAGVELLWGPGIRVLKAPKEKRTKPRVRRPTVRKTMIEGEL